MLHFLNIFFFIFHTVFTSFNMVGWAYPQTRKLHLITMLLTCASWFVLGIWYGWGYCFCTDWHWQVREAMGYADQSHSYVNFLLQHLTGINFNANLVDIGTLGFFLFCLLASFWANRKWLLSLLK